MNNTTEDLRILDINEVVTPEELHAECPLTEKAANTVQSSRRQVHNILSGKDDRLLVVVGPCSIHDPEAAKDYARRLKALSDKLANNLMVVMRVYFEKPRTTVGWKGLINDPCLDGSFEINIGLHLARQLLVDINDIGLPAGVEFLDLITPQYLADLVSWGSIGARTTESQLHRELASGLSCPIGFKNGTSGNLKVAIDAIRAANRPHNFLSMTKTGKSAIFTTAGNKDCHIILRGGKTANYDANHVAAASRDLEAVGLEPQLMIDISHANSGNNHQQQMLVGEDVARQLAQGDRRIIGVMIESHIQAGRQDVVDGEPLTYGQSITDACISWEQTEQLLEQFSSAVNQQRNIYNKQLATGG